MRSYQENDLVEIEEEATADNECPGEEYLLTRAAEQGFVTYDDVLTVFPQPEEKLEELEDILATLIEAGVEVRSPKEREKSEKVKCRRNLNRLMWWPTGKHTSTQSR